MNPIVNGVEQRLRRPLHALGALGLALALVWPHTALAQMASEAGAGVTWQTYSFGDADAAGIEDLTLLTIPVAYTARFGSFTALDVRTAWASGTLTRPGGTESTIQGLTDIEVSLARTFAQDALVASIVGVLPTGTSTQSLEEAEVAATVAADLLPFRISNWGTGGGIGGSLAVARTVNGYGLGASVGYIMAGEFEPRSGDATVFQPGDLFRINAVVDRSIAGRSKLSLRVGYQRFGDDGLDGLNLFRSGDRYEATGSYAFPAGQRASAIVYAGFLRRDEGAYLGDPRTSASQDLLLAGGAMRTPFGTAVLTPTVDLRLVRRSDGVSQGYLGGVGAAAEFPLEGVTLIPSLRLQRGTVEIRQDLDSAVTGVEAGLAVRFGRVR